MAAESTVFNANDKAIIMAIAKKFMPLTFKEGHFGNGHANIIHFKTPSSPLILKSENGNEFIVSELVTKTFFEQYIHFCYYLFERDTEKEQIPRTQPIPVSNFHEERAACYAWINYQQERGKKGCNEIDWHVKRIKELFNIDYAISAF